MNVIPVLDLKGRRAVHAVGGKRSKYLPVKSQLCKGSDPIDVARAFKSKLGLGELYVADLDAIERVGDHLDILQKITNTLGIQVMLDSGVNNSRETLRILEMGVRKIVVGTETLSTLSNLRDMLSSFGGDKVLPSIDTRDGEVITKSNDLKGMSLTEVARTLITIGASELIFLDLSRVGAGLGFFPTLENLLNDVDVPVLVGGGVRGLDDLLALRDLGVAGALVATSIHRGLLTKRELELLS